MTSKQKQNLILPTCKTVNEPIFMKNFRVHHAKWRATPQSACQCHALLLEFSMPDLIVCLQELENQVNKRLFFLQQKGKEVGA